MTIKRKLSALDYSNTEINIEDQNQFRKLIIWLEQNKIKHYDGNKNPLMDPSSNDWSKHYENYLNALGCSIPAAKTEAALDWCLGHAVQLEYSKASDQYNKYAVENLKTSKVPNVVADNPLDHLDFTSKEFREEINKVANILKVPPHSDALITLEACSKVVQKRLHSDALQNPKNYIIKGTPFPYKNADLGFELNDTTLNEAAKLMRLLYIQDLRNLQTKANECIVAVQNVTADPKTDTKLGKVGK